MKLDVKVLRYMSQEHFRVLTAIEMGMKNHDLVPIPLIVMISALKHGGVHKILSDLLRDKLVTHERGMYEGYKLTYGGYDYLALRAMVKRGTIASVGQQIGVGKESDIYIVENDAGEQLCLKLHRLGRISFRSIKSKRDYLKSGQSASWLYMSRLAAIKEYAFMKALHDAGFPTPTPIDQSRHCILMSFAQGIPLYQMRDVPHPEQIRDQMFQMIIDLAEHGLIHGDFNEYNMLIDDNLKLTLIDFPQMVSTSHVNAEYYFNRDVECVCRFFLKKLYIETDDSLLPKLENIKNVKELDVQVKASGFKSEDDEALLKLMEEGREQENEGIINNNNNNNEEEEGEEEEEPESIDNEDTTNYIVDENEVKELEAYKKQYLEEEGEEEEEEEDENDNSDDNDDEEEEENHHQYEGKNVCFLCGKEGHKAKKCPTITGIEINDEKNPQIKQKKIKKISDYSIRNKIRTNLDKRTARNQTVSRNMEKNRERRLNINAAKEWM